MDEKFRLQMNLQWFAKDGDGGEKTEEPTAKKLSDARKDGKVAKSRELNNAVGLFVLFGVLQVTISSLSERMLGLFKTFYNIIPDYITENSSDISSAAVARLFQEAVIDAFWMVLPFFAVGFFAMAALDLYQVKWKVTAKPLKPKLSKFNPINGFKRIFSKNSLVELVKSIAKIILIAWISYGAVQDNERNLLFLCDMPILQAIMLIGSIIISTGFKISAVMLILGIADYIYQKWKFKEDMKMTKQEVKDEYKNAEGDPQIKGKQRARMREASQRRMMQAVPQADVVITNPTHLAVALKYDADEAQAPVVLAKGADYLAQQIKEKAKEANVEIIENKPLARMLYANVEIGEEIPPELYQTVAEILAAVYRLKNKI